MSPPPPVLLLPAPTTARALAGPAGWRPRDGFALPSAPWDLSAERWLCVGRVAGPADAEAAVTALARGVGLAVVVEVDGDVRHHLLEDLHRAGAVQARVGDGDLDPVLSDEQRLLLSALAGGASLAAAAQSAHMSRRTANRRMAEIRRRLGVTTTAEAVTWAAQRAPRPGP